MREIKQCDTRGNAMKKFKKKSLKITSVILALTMILSILPMTALAEEAVITGFADFDISEHYLYVDENNRPDEAELIAEMPSTLEVYLSGSDTPVSVDVSWYCITEDYATAEDHYLQFSPIFNYEVADGIDVETDAPYIGVFLREGEEVMAASEETLNGITREEQSKANRETIYKYLTQTLGYNMAAACGILANIESECSFMSNNLQSIGNSALNWTDEQYTTAVDNGTYTKTVKNDNGTTETKDTRWMFSHDSYGYGLCQWTYWSRKQNLYDYAKKKEKSISDISMQLDFMDSEELPGYYEKQSDGTKTYLKRDILKNATLSWGGAYYSAYKFCTIYEQPSKTEERAKARGNLAVEMWKNYSGQSSASTTSYDRIQGNNRYETAIAVADELLEIRGEDKFDSIVLARANDFPDALSGVPFAYEKNAPILLVNENGVGEGNQKTLDYIATHLDNGGTVYLLGAKEVVPDSVKTYLSQTKNKSYNYVRLAGNNRYETNMKIVNAMAIEKGSDVYIACGKNFPDALSVSGGAASSNSPIILADSALSQEALNKIAEISPSHIYIIGAKEVVSENVESQLSKLKKNVTSVELNYSVTRLYGDQRYKTAVAVSEALYSPNVSKAIIATGQNFPDGLVAGLLAAELDIPLLLVSDIHTTEAKTYLASRGTSYYYVMGAEGAVSEKAVIGVMH